jgi:shikimate dehydrogenase
MMAVTGGTRVCLMVGHPVDKARTPAFFNDWAARAGHDVVMVGAAVDAAGLPALVKAMRCWQGCVGAVVTYPHKQAAFALLDHADKAAAFNAACNVIRRGDDGRLTGTMTDGIGCVSAMARHGGQLAGGEMLLIGAGGAGSAIAHEAARRGAARIVVLDTDPARRDALATRLEAAFPALRVVTNVPGDLRPDVACNATPLGMNGETVLPFDVAVLPEECLVVDVVPTPAMTPWLIAAQARGLRVQTGPEMVAAQFGHVAGHLLGLDPADIGQI